MVEGSRYGLVGRDIEFGVVQCIVNNKEKGYAIAIAISSVAKGLLLAPPPSEAHEYISGDRVVIFKRTF